MKTRSIALALPTLALCAATALPAAAQQRFRVTDLGTLGGNFSRAFDINNRGQVVGEAIRPDARMVPFLYSGGVMRELKIPASKGKLLSANSINDKGWVTGGAMLPASATCSECQRAYIYDGMKIKFLGHLGQGSEGTSWGSGINNAGHVAGGASLSDEPGGETHAFFYDGNRMRDLGKLGSNFSYGNAINERGWVAGLSFVDASPDRITYHAFIYKNGAMRDLGTLGGFDSAAYAINDKGWVTGQSHNKRGVEEAYIHDGRSMRGLGPRTGAGWDINSRGWVVGSGSGNDAFLYDRTAVRNLNDLLVNRGRWRLLSAYGINDKNQIVGFGLPDKANGDVMHAFLLTPVAETE